jgi:hypothetical protein
MVEAERAARAKAAAAASWPRGPLLQGRHRADMVGFLQKHGAPFDISDFAEFYARSNSPR